MRGSGIPIWFFIGVLLTAYGAMIFGYGVFEWVNVAHFGGQYPAGVQLTQLHTPVWWGGLLTALGVLYVVKFRPGASSSAGLQTGCTGGVHAARQDDSSTCKCGSGDPHNSRPGGRHYKGARTWQRNAR